MNERERYIRESEELTRELLHEQRRPWPTNRLALSSRGIDVSKARIVDRIEDNDYLDYMIVVTGDKRVYLYFVKYEPSTEPEVVDWEDITNEVKSNPHARAIQAVLSSISG